MVDQYKYGIGKEKQVAEMLRKAGADVSLSPGSKGAADITVKFPTGTKWLVQVKATRKGDPPMLPPTERTKLLSKAIKQGATPVVAKVARGKITLESARSARRLTPPKKGR
jgi:Holliday junction resolvase